MFRAINIEVIYTLVRMQSSILHSSHQRQLTVMLSLLGDNTITWFPINNQYGPVDCVVPLSVPVVFDRSLFGLRACIALGSHLSEFLKKTLCILACWALVLNPLHAIMMKLHGRYYIFK